MIEVKELSKRFGQKVAVQNLSFDARPGMVTGFLGPNGAGKSTTMRVMLGLDSATDGEVLINGRRYSRIKHPMRSIGALLDANWVHPNRSSRSHLLWIAQMGGISPRRVDEVLDLVGLTAVADKRAGGFSLGMKQRLGLAGALLGDPEHLVLDEPLNGLDPEGVHWMREVIRGHAKAGNTVLISSHLLSEMSQTADDLVVIGRGELIGQYGIDEFISVMAGGSVRVRVDRPELLHDALSERGISCSWDGSDAPVLATGSDHVTTDAIGGICFALGIQVRELTQVSGSLEDAYLLATADSVDFHARQEVAA